MPARSSLVLLLLLSACAARSHSVDQTFQQAREGMWRGELADAQQLA